MDTYFDILKSGTFFLKYVFRLLFFNLESRILNPELESRILSQTVFNAFPKTFWDFRSFEQNSKDDKEENSGQIFKKN